ncbi:MAG: hypothetical protein JNJ60_08245, partial [Rhodocyclaceae bacterium]|nr:hypothetical protein [Rhodocyclaceae bacterium]
MLLEARLENIAQRWRHEAGGIALRLELWNGKRFDLGPAPRVTIRVPTRAALATFFSPTLHRLAEACIEGRIEVQGALRDM